MHELQFFSMVCMHYCDAKISGQSFATRSSLVFPDSSHQDYSRYSDFRERNWGGDEEEEGMEGGTGPH
jgi:hypothetical protein